VAFWADATPWVAKAKKKRKEKEKEKDGPLALGGGLATPKG
jgi:hypothetical protein